MFSLEDMYNKILNDDEKALDNFYKFGDVPADDDEQGWQQWEKEQEELEQKAPNYWEKINRYYR